MTTIALIASGITTGVCIGMYLVAHRVVVAQRRYIACLEETDKIRDEVIADLERKLAEKEAS